MLDGERYTKRCHRRDFAGHAHELTFNCYLNRSFLSRERTCAYLVESINAARRKHDFDLWAYVFMPNHVHLVICPRYEIYSISDILLSIKQPVSHKAIEYLREHNPAGLRLLATGQRARPYHFWQKGGGYDRNITSLDALLETMRYIHNNPVRKGLVQHQANGTAPVRQIGKTGRPGPYLSTTIASLPIKPSPRPAGLEAATQPFNPPSLGRLVAGRQACGFTNHPPTGIA